MRTILSRNHYGLHAQSVDGSMLFSTMRVYSGDIVTSVNRITKQSEHSIISEPTGYRLAHLEKVKRLTPNLLKMIHENNVKELQNEILVK